MKTARTTRASFSADPPTINVTLPTTWTDLSQPELLFVYRTMCARADSGAAAVWFAIFRRLARAKVARRAGEKYVLRFIASEGGKLRRVYLCVSPEELAELLMPLSFISSPGDVPVRLDRWHRATAVDAALHGVDFGTYLQIENLYQGYLLDPNNEDVFFKLASILYPGVKHRHIDEVFVLNVLQWVVQIKSMFARQWANFFKPAAAGGEAPSMLEVMNNEIRALTGGDVTKEDVIFATDCWRALTELDFKAKEADEMKRELAKHSK